MNLKHYPVRKKVDVHTAIGAGIWKEIEKIAAREDQSKIQVINNLLAKALASQKRRK